MLDRMADWAVNNPASATCGLLLIILLLVIGVLAALEKRNPMDDEEV